MKKFSLLVVMALMCLCGFAQNYRGDVNDDKKIDVADVVGVVGIVMGTNPVVEIPVIHDTILVEKHDTVTIVQYCDTTYNDTIIPIKDEHESVDLGLPSGTLWAACNVGATSPEEFGTYFAWGETTPQEDNIYSWTSYKWCSGSNTTMTKYGTNSKYGTVDNKTVLASEDDAATANWGSNWCMPTQAQFAELINPNNTTTTWTTQNDVCGRLITSNTNGKSIFLPVAGYISDHSIYSEGTYGGYWSSEVYSSRSSSAWILILYSGGITSSGVSNRCYGRSVRPVRQ